MHVVESLFGPAAMFLAVVDGIPFNVYIHQVFLRRSTRP